MHPMALAFHIIDLRGVQPPQAALHRHSQIVPGAAAELFLGLLQLLRKGKIGHRLEHIVQRAHGVALDGVLGHVGDEEEHHVPVQLSDAPGRLHPVQMLHLHIQQDDVVHGAVCIQNLHPIGKFRHRKLGAVLAGIPLDVALQLFPDSRFVFHHGNADHSEPSFLLSSSTPGALPQWRRAFPGSSHARPRARCAG